MKFFDLLQSEILLLDSSTRSAINGRNILKAGECTEFLNISRPVDIMDIHIGSLLAGANIITANTGNANAMCLAPFGLEKRTEELVQTGVALALEAIQECSRPAFAAAVVSSTGEQYSSDARMPQRMYNAFYEQCIYASAAGADLIFIEGMSDIMEARLALLAARAATRLPILVGFALEPDESTFAGNPPEVLSLIAYKLGASLVGVNCALPPNELFPGYSRLMGSTAIPAFAVPNAGTSALARLSPEEMAEGLIPYIHSGASIVGGCCYTTAEHLRALRTLLDRHHGHAKRPKPIGPYLCAAQKRVGFLDFEENTPISLHNLTMEAAVCCIAAAAKEQAELQIDLGDWNGESIRLLLWRLSDQLKKTPLCFHAHTARQANAALFAYPGIAAVCALSDTYNVLKAAARYGAEVMH